VTRAITSYRVITRLAGLSLLSRAASAIGQISRAGTKLGLICMIGDRFGHSISSQASHLCVIPLPSPFKSPRSCSTSCCSSSRRAAPGLGRKRKAARTSYALSFLKLLLQSGALFPGENRRRPALNGRSPVIDAIPCLDEGSSVSRCSLLFSG
jgi:hypothetical protein